MIVIDYKTSRLGSKLTYIPQIIFRIYEYIKSGKDKEIVDPDPNKIYSRRKSRIVESNSSKDSSDSRKTVTFPTDNWSTSLAQMPLFTIAELNNHIVNSGKRSGGQDHHSVPTNLIKAKKFLDDEYLEEIESNHDAETFYFKSKCCHSFRKNEPPHQLKIAICIVSGEVKRSICTCVAGKSGFCNHILALMFKLCKFSLYQAKTTSDLCEEEDQTPSTSCTSNPQRWHKRGGGSNIAPEPVMEVVVKKTKMEGEVDKGCIKSLLYEARKNPEHVLSAEKTLKSDLFQLNPNVGIAHMFHDSDRVSDTKETMFGNFQVGSCLSYQLAFTEANFHAVEDISIVDRLPVPLTNAVFPPFPLSDLADEMTVPDNLTPTELELLEKLTVTKSEIVSIEEATRLQAKSDRWKDERKFRFTASNFHRISRRVRNHDTLAEELINPKPISARNLEHGRRYEPIALIAYEKYMHKKGMPVKVLDCGFVVNKGHPILGASPDARVIDAGCVHPYGIVEVKCPATKFQVTPLDACSDPSFFMEKIGDDKCALKRSDKYYAQVQGQLAITGARWCDFVIYTKVGMYIQRITLDVPYWEDLKEKLTTYYFKHFVKFAVLHFRGNNCDDNQ